MASFINIQIRKKTYMFPQYYQAGNITGMVNHMDLLVGTALC